MQFSAIIAAAFAGFAAAQAPYALVAVESSHGGAGNGLVNKTIQVPLDTVYTNPAVLNEVSTLYLISCSQGTNVYSVVCQPHKDPAGTDTGAKPFDIKTPSRLSTNTVVVGSITCHA
ncbi:hypothetical protein PC116_g32337 [Phytophthora cactorum]|uniref:Uncharacterized protein n=1 Tax=Daldinia eschscholtzii TaxID=292717 RepID=A0AAX6MPD1_9PEZI|nr:hypothetical protein PC116_g32337 [Phytophthora cactorum]